MIGTGQSYVPSRDQSPLDGIRVADMISDDVKVSADGKVTGTVNYLTKVEGYPADQQSGHYFPTAFTKANYKKLHVGGAVSGDGFTAGKEITPSADDPYLVIRVENCTDGNKISVFDFESKDEILKLDFNETTLAPPMGEKAVSVAPQEKDFGDFGKVSEMIGDDVSIAWDGTTGKVTGNVKWYNGKTKVTEGNRFPIVLDKWFKDNIRNVSVYIKNPKTIQGETEWIIYLDGKDTPITIKDGETVIATLDLSGVTLATKQGEP